MSDLPRRYGDSAVLIDRAVIDEAERLVGYWERHGGNPRAVSAWAVSDLLGFVRYFAELD